jgi:hypothetical protein
MGLSKSVAAVFRAGLALAATATMAVGCASGAAGAEAAGGPADGPRFVLELSPGSEYRTTTRWFIFEVPVYPQVAAWVESPAGQYLGTIFVTDKAAKRSWMSAPQAGRPEALPVWSHLAAVGVDAVAAATAAGETRHGSALAGALPAGRYVIKLKTNRSYDYNAAYPAATSGVCGQPSLVYAAEIAVGEGPAEVEFAPIGTGALDGADGQVYPGLAGIDTALRLFASMKVAYRG